MSDGIAHWIVNPAWVCRIEKAGCDARWYEDPAYIKMCLMAEEIQLIGSACKMESGSWVFPPGATTGMTSDEFVADDFGVRISDGAVVWLPRLDQLWGMVLGDGCAVEIQSGRGVIHGNTPKFDSASAERAVLMALMWELYGKRWTGEEWK